MRFGLPAAPGDGPRAWLRVSGRFGVLQVSDLHITPGQDAKRAWVRSLASLEPDFVVNTGDSLSHRDAVPEVLDALGPLLDRPGAFVLGSNDYFSPGLKNPLRYLTGGTGVDVRPQDRRQDPDLPWRDLVRPHERCGLGRSRQRLGAGQGRRPRDRAARRGRPAHPAGPLRPGGRTRRDRTPTSRWASSHAPYHRVVDRMAADGLPLVLAGHTHGGQLCVPFCGALVTNCDLSPRRAKGLSRHTDDTWLHVSAGLGTSPYAPIRFACPPEATLLTLVARAA